MVDEHSLAPPVLLLQPRRTQGPSCGESETLRPGRGPRTTAHLALVS